MSYEFLDDGISEWENMQRLKVRYTNQRDRTQWELDHIKGSTEGWAELHKAEVDRLEAKIAELEAEMCLLFDDFI